MKNVEVRSLEGCRWMVTYEGVDHFVASSRMVPYVIGSLVGSLDGVSVNGIPLEKWIYIF